MKTSCKTPDVPPKPVSRRRDAVVGVQIDLLVLDASPQPLDEHVVAPPPLPSMLMRMSCLRADR